MISSNESRELTVELEAGAITALAYVPESIPPTASVILGHGAGAGQRSPFIIAFARALRDHGLRVVTFDFPYMQQRRRLPDRTPVLEACYVRVVHAVRAQVHGADDALVIGGKSMGGRIATQIAASDPSLPIRGLVLLGYPLHPPGRPDSRRDAHLPKVAKPMLFVQGSRDTFGTPDELAPVLHRLRPQPALHIVEGGDHSFKVSGRSEGTTAASRQSAAYAAAQSVVVDWIETLMAAPTTHASRSDIP